VLKVLRPFGARRRRAVHDPKETSVGHWTRSNIARFEGFNAIAKRI
jgi:hypothetical protein